MSRTASGRSPVAAGALGAAAALLLAPAPAAAQDLSPLGGVVAPTLLLVPPLLAYTWLRLLDSPRRPKPRFALLWLASAVEVVLWLAAGGFLLVALFFGRWWAGTAAAVAVASLAGWAIHGRRLRAHGARPRSWRVIAAAAFAPFATLLAVLASWGVLAAVER